MNVCLPHQSGGNEFSHFGMFTARLVGREDRKSVV